MVSREDAEFVTLLHRELLRILDGDDKAPGLRRTILNSKDFNEFLATKGEIKAYGSVISLMGEIIQHMNQNESSDEHRRGMN